jgi:hypothetical protein
MTYFSRKLKKNMGMKNEQLWSMQIRWVDHTLSVTRKFFLGTKKFLIYKIFFLFCFNNTYTALVRDMSHIS